MLRRAFTLIELLVAMTLVVVVVTAASTVFFQMLASTKRLQALQSMDAAARTVAERMELEATVIHPCAALWLTSKAGAEEVELVFMRGKFNWLDWLETRFPWDVSADLGYTNLLWSRWHWNAASGLLQVSASRPCRWSVVDNGATRNYWRTSPNGMNNTVSTFISIPQLQRETGTATDPNSPVELLNRNCWGIGEASDVGDHRDLELNAVPLLYHCSDLTIELVNLDGAVQTADGRSDLAWAAPGTYVDGRDHADLLARPSRIRLRFTLTDPKLQVSRTYSFSFSTPSFAKP